MTKKQQIGNIRAEAARHGITLKQILSRADLPYQSVKNAMHFNNVSQHRLDAISKALNELIAESNDNIKAEKV